MFSQIKHKYSLSERTGLILSVLLFMLAGCQDRFPEKVSPISKFSQLQELFADPPADYRSAPLWDWNTQDHQRGN